jgi:biotin synthase
MFDLDRLLKRVTASVAPDVEDVARLLALSRGEDLTALFKCADGIRRERMGEGIFLRGLIEISNHCGRTCAYCGLNARNRSLKRFRLSLDEVLASVGVVVANGLSTVVLQAGEDAALTVAWVEDLIRRIKLRFDTAVTLSLGERPEEEYLRWRRAGADRYLLKMETTNPVLYADLHPGMSFEARRACLKTLKRLGYQTGSGNIVGLKGQTLVDIARDILFFKDEMLDMIGIGPFIPHGATPLAGEEHGSALLTLKTVAVTRIVIKTAHIPATTALGSLEKDFRSDALKAGANVLMPNFTPQTVRSLYEIYPNKRCVTEAAGSCVGCMEAMAASCGRSVDYSRGDSFRQQAG